MKHNLPSIIIVGALLIVVAYRTWRRTRRAKGILAERKSVWQRLDDAEHEWHRQALDYRVGATPPHLRESMWQAIELQRGVRQ